MYKHLVLALVVVTVSSVLSACGGGAAAPTAAPTEAAPAATAAATEAAAPVTLTATLSDTGLTPSTFSAATGAKVTFTVQNTGTAERDCVFFDVATMKLFPGQSQWSLNQIGAGTTKSLDMLAPLKPASYKIDCGTAGFSGQPRTPTPGLTGTFDVK